ncbi:MAG TPA: hypothetical protein VFF98_12995 [Novosphingobium sp.]|nr:hypothetical protein [Novosphingobium sp.]
MRQNNKTPAGIADQAGASRDGWRAASLFTFSLDAYRAQFLMCAYAVRPEIAVMLAVWALRGANG